MIITKEFLDNAGRRSALARKALVQAGDQHRNEALKKFLLSVGSCEITMNDLEVLGLRAYEKKYCFMAEPLIYALLDAETFKRCKRFDDIIDLQAAYARNGVIGILARSAVNV
ncbi:MAG: hypothetical protein LBK56_14200 [Gracilibacteraceae bacterium]|jgi:hypothetical protein|nr:hypothetical protein [Gracilibacteraceae bacterium]